MTESVSRAASLRLNGVTVQFGGLRALDGVSFTVEPGSIHALIGPNGAGKSSCFNVLSGVYRASAGSVRLDETELVGLAPHRIAEQGVGRTFQNIAMTRGSVIDNLMLGRHTLTRAGYAASVLSLRSARREQERHRQRALDIADFVGLSAQVGSPVAALSYGQRKRVEVARALCMEPRLLLLDEPVAGMNTAERVEMAALIGEIRSALDLSVLIVEHDMGLIMRLADQVTVLDFGQVIADASPAEVQRDPEVQRAYLGGAPAAEPTGTAVTTRGTIR